MAQNKGPVCGRLEKSNLRHAGAFVRAVLSQQFLASAPASSYCPRTLERPESIHPANCRVAKPARPSRDAVRRGRIAARICLQPRRAPAPDSVMATSTITIFVEREAPVKPAFGAACNGCGVCCLHEPCPLGVLLSRRRHGSCAALYWSAPISAYRCGAMDRPGLVLQNALPAFLRWGVPALAPLLARTAPRWIAASKGCDSTLEVERAP